MTGIYREQKCIEDLKNKCNDYKNKYNNNFIVKVKLLWFIIKNFVSFPKYKSVKDNNLHILFRLGGGIGDIIIALNYIYIIEQNLKDIKEKLIIDFLIPNEFYDSINILLQNSNLKFNNLKTKKTISYNYDFVAHLERIPVLKYANLNKIKKISNKFYEFTNLLIDFKNNNFNLLSSSGTDEVVCRNYTVVQNRNREYQANIENYWNSKFNLKITAKNQNEVLKKFNLCNKNFITVQRGVGLINGHQPDDCSTRIWSLEKYKETINLLKLKYPDCIIIQIGSNNSVPIDNVDENLCGKTNFNELITLLDAAFLHFDCECGMVHLRHYICRKPSIVIFGPTKKDFYGYEENINIGNDSCIGCDWLHKNWKTKCIRTTNRYSCLETLSPRNVIDELEKHNL